MIIIFDRQATDRQISEVIKSVEDMGLRVHRSTGDHQVVIGVLGMKPEYDTRKLLMLEGVAKVYRVSDPYKFVSRQAHPHKTVIRPSSTLDVAIGGDQISVIAGPCAVESEDQIFSIAESVSQAGAKVLRGGAFKPRSSPYSFQGLGREGLSLLRKAADAYRMVLVTEILESNQVDLIGEYTDIFQVGARNMHNSTLLKALGKAGKPVLLKRSPSATIDEWLMSAEYVAAGGNPNIFLCERGIRSFESYTRYTFDISAIPVVQSQSHLPIIADPSHAAGFRDKVMPLARAAVAAGADGLMIEVHNNPVQALSDGPQALLPVQFKELMDQIRLIAEAIGKTV